MPRKTRSAHYATKRKPSPDTLKPTPVFLDLEEVDDSRVRVSWLTWEGGAEVYRGKPVATAKEAVRREERREGKSVQDV